MNSTYFFIWILFFGQFLRFLASTSDGMNNDTVNPEAENITDKPEIQWTRSFGNETTLDMYIFPATAAAVLFIIPLLVFVVCMYKLVQEKKEVIDEESPPVTAETTSATPKSPDRTMPRENTEQTEASIVKILLEPSSDHLPPGNIITFLESLMPLYEKPSKKSKKVLRTIKIEEAVNNNNAEALMRQFESMQKKSPDHINLKTLISYEQIEEGVPPLQVKMETTSLSPSTSEPESLVCGEQIEEDDSKGSPSLELETKTTYFPLQSSELERREKREDTEMRTAPTKESLETCLPRGALSFLEQLRSSFKKPSGNRKCKKVLRTMRIEELISDDEDTAQYSEEYLRQLKQLCNESPTAHDPRIEVQVVPIEPSAECKDEKEGEIPQQTELESIPFQQQPSEAESEVQIPEPEVIIDICSDEEDELHLQTELECDSLLQKSSESQSEVRIEMVEDVKQEGKKTFIEELFHYLLSTVYVLPTYFPTLAGSPSTEQSESEPESEVQIPEPEVIIDICSDEEDELHLQTELECDSLLQKSSEPQSEVRIEMVEDVKQEGKKTFIEEIFYYLLSSVYVLPTYFPTLAGSPSTEQSESEHEREKQPDRT
ncbi:hypothetical protein XELAEV_18031815mg [Xenopus laevis]|uniref:Uncharacterized protein n=1 Tax=Xenopus laevis TaxID=8355 RepID=A0A974CPX8_XENLA|nr:hypothetical protein XELAEV_18031815mg [Xenopus laevis]